MAAATPPTDERLLLHLVKNHQEFKQTLSDLSLTSDIPVLEAMVLEVAKAWFNLALEHLGDAKEALKSGRERSIYSRSYYAAYNGSKCIRFLVNGWVSRKGDDHQKAPDLPTDFPTVAGWSARISELYEHRLRADYDNWSSTKAEHTLTPADCVAFAEAFLKECQAYATSKFGVTL